MKFAGLLAYIDNNMVVIFAMMVVLSHFEQLQNLLDSDIACLWGVGCAVELQSEVLVTVVKLAWLCAFVPLVLAVVSVLLFQADGLDCSETCKEFFFFCSGTCHVAFGVRSSGLVSGNLRGFVTLYLLWCYQLCCRSIDVLNCLAGGQLHTGCQCQDLRWPSGLHSLRNLQGAEWPGHWQQQTASSRGW